MSSWKINLWVLSISVVFTSASYTMIIPFLPVYLLEIGVDETEVAMWSGAIFSVSFLVGAIMAPIWGKIADKSGKRLMALRAGFCLGAVYLLGAFVTSPEQLFVVRILQGFANGFMPAALALVSSSVPQKELGVSLGMMQTGQIVGSVVGPLLGGTLAHVFGMRVSFLIAGVLLLLVTAIVAIRVKEPEKVKDINAGSSIFEDLKRSMHNSVLVKMLLLTIVVQIAIMVLQPVVTLYVGELQGNMDDAVFTSGVIFSLGGIAGAFAAPVWGKLGQSKGYIKTMACAFIGAGFFNFLQFFPTSILGFAGLQFLFGLFIVGIHPSISAVLVKCTETSFRGRVFGIATTAHQCGSMIGPLLGGLISSTMGTKFVFFFTGIMLFLIGVIVFARRKKIRIN